MGSLTAFEISIYFMVTVIKLIDNNNEHSQYPKEHKNLLRPNVVYELDWHIYTNCHAWCHRTYKRQREKNCLDVLVKSNNIVHYSEHSYNRTILHFRVELNVEMSNRNMMLAIVL